MSNKKLILFPKQDNSDKLQLQQTWRDVEPISYLGEGVEEIGGLFVLGTEKHESRRIDNQLRGRSGRQGDHGESRFFLSLEDDMFKRFAKDDLEKFLKKVTTDEDGLVQNPEVDELTERTQRIVEGAHYSMREYNLKLDDVINDQREVVYTLRDKVLEAKAFSNN